MHFKIKNPLKRLRLMLKELDNYYFFIRKVETLNDTGELHRNKLKKNKKHEMYGAINMPPELLLYHSQEDVEQLEKTFFGNEMAKINDMMIDNQIIELFVIDYERVKDDDYYAYLFNIRYKWKYCNIRSISVFSAGIIGLAFCLIYGIVKLASA